MNRFFSTFLIICLMLSICGCDAVENVGKVELPPVPTSEETSAPVETPVETVAPITETQHQHIIINMDKTEFEAYDPQQGTEHILSFSYETPYVHIPASPMAEDAINEFIAMLDESFYTGDNYGVVYDSGCAPGYINMLTMAEDNYNYIINSALNFDSSSMGFELANHRSFTVQRCDERVLSLLYYDYINLGGVHGSYAYRGYSFDTVSGELLTLDDICQDSVALRAFLKSYMLEEVNSSPELQQQVEGFVDLEGMPSLEEAVGALLREGSWYFDNKGMYIVSDLYELGSYAAGTMEFYISYNALGAHIKPEYIPSSVTGTGSFVVVPVEALSESSREIIDMIRLDDEGQGIYLVMDGRARNVRISSVDYTDHFYETGHIWHCSAMTDCAIQLVTLIPEGMPNIKISYTDAEGEHSLLLTQSGEDGSIILVNDDIEAVG